MIQLIISASSRTATNLFLAPDVVAILYFPKLLVSCALQARWLIKQPLAPAEQIKVSGYDTAFSFTAVFPPFLVSLDITVIYENNLPEHSA